MSRSFSSHRRGLQAKEGMTYEVNSKRLVAAAIDALERPFLRLQSALALLAVRETGRTPPLSDHPKGMLTE